MSQNKDRYSESKLNDFFGFPKVVGIDYTSEESKISKQVDESLGFTHVSLRVNEDLVKLFEIYCEARNFTVLAAMSRSLKSAVREISNIANEMLIENVDQMKLWLKTNTPEGLKFIHIKISDFSDDTKSDSLGGGTTIAYMRCSLTGNMVEVSTSICNPKDQYNKIVGKYLAVLAFKAGEKIKIRCENKLHIKYTLIKMFSPYVYLEE